MGWITLTDRYLAWMRASGARPETIRTRRYWLHRFVNDTEGRDRLDPDVLVDWLGGSNWAPATMKSARQSVVGFYRWGHERGFLSSDPAAELPRVRVPRNMPRPTDEVLLLQCVAECPDRDRLMLMLAACAGLRRSEIARLRREDLTGNGLRIAGKGGRVRYVPVGDELRGMILDAPAGYLFPGRWTGHMHVASVGKCIRRAMHWQSSAHPLRHRFASRAYSGTRDLRAVQELLGHSDPATTAIYTALADDSLEEAVEAAALIPQPRMNGESNVEIIR